MVLTKLGSLTVHLVRKNQLLQRLAVHQPKTLSSLRHNSTLSGKKKDEDDDELDQPIKYSSSKASKWSAAASRTGLEYEDKPWYQPIVVSVSVAVFMIYFCILREENDVDEKLTWNLSDHFEGEKKASIEASQKIYWDYVGKGGPSKPNSS